MLNKSIEIISFFKEHPRFPFLEWNINYDDYCAVNLLLLNLVKAKISPTEVHNWHYRNAYYNYRLNGSEGMNYPFGCINHKKQQVLLLGTAKKEDEDMASMSIQLSNESFYWEAYKNSIMEEGKENYYEELNIYLDIRDREAVSKLEEILALFFDPNVESKQIEDLCGYYINGDFSGLLKD